MMKLYLLVAIVEVFDRLMCGFGQDALDSLYWNTTRRPHAHPRLIVSLVVVFVYALLHSLVLFLHITTVNVAMNSADHALLSLLIGGNFAEIKGTVFKKYSKKNLFQITMSDVCERFKLLLFLFLIMMLNFFQERDEHLYKWLQMGALVLASETLCDWIKHSFITRLNFIRSDVYEDYSLILAGDVTGIGHEGVNLDNTHAVVKRLGLAQIPILCVTMRYLREALRYFYMNHNNKNNINGHWTNMAQVSLLIFAALLIIKVLLGMILAVFASRTVCIIGNRQQVNSNTNSPNNTSCVPATNKVELAEKQKRKVV
jgi:hypothetical protein